MKSVPHSYLFLSLLAEKIKVLIVGGGKAAAIKANTFLNRGCRVTVVAKTLCDDFTRLDAENIRIIHATYHHTDLSGHHLVVIATDDTGVNRQIQHDCDERDKLYLTCSDYRDGQFVTPVMRETEQASLAVHTKSGSPRTSLFVADKLQEQLTEYDRFIEYVCELRSRIKDREDKDEIMGQINSEEFFALFKQNKHHEFCEQ